MSVESLLVLDRELFYLINHGWANAFFDRLFPFVTHLDNFVPLILVLVVWLAWRGGRRGRVCLLGVALAVGISDPLVVRVIKPTVDRDRPCITLEDTRLLVSRKASPSFPSAHASNMFAVATIFGWCYRRSLVVVLPFATLVSLSRVYIGVHYVGDSIAGAIVGLGVGLMVVGLLTTAGRRIRWLSLAPATARPGPTAATLLLLLATAPSPSAAVAPEPAAAPSPAGAPGPAAGARPPSEVTPGSEPSTIERIVDAAIARTARDVRYDGSYRRIAYPWGDVPDSIGVCTDLVVRSFRAAGIDLQRLVHEDMTGAFESYPQSWGLYGPDRNIDHRRVPNLQTFFTRTGAALEVTTDAGDYLPGDVVTWVLPGDVPHIGIVVDRPAIGGGPPLVVHNIGAGPEMEDVLFAYPVTGHYRIDGRLTPRGTSSAPRRRRRRGSRRAA